MPANFEDATQKFWRQMVKDYDFGTHELRLLEDICRELDLIDRLEEKLRKSPLMEFGSQGQPVASPLVQEIRQHRATMARLMVALKLPDEADSPGARSTAARTLAGARWSKGA